MCIKAVHEEEPHHPDNVRQHGAKRGLGQFKVCSEISLGEFCCSSERDGRRTVVARECNNLDALRGDIAHLLEVGRHVGAKR